MAERVGRAFLDEVLGEDAGAIRLISAGTRAVVGSDMHPDSALVLRGFGADAGDFRAQQYIGAMAADADLILTMTRRHRQSVLTAAPRALARTFTLREAADLLSMCGDIEPVGGDIGERARNLVKQLAAARSRRPSGDADDIRDPIGRPVEVHEDVAESVVATLLPVLRRIAGLHPASPVGHVGRGEAPAAHGVGASPGM